MALTTTAKLVIPIVILAVIAGMVTTIVLLVNREGDEVIASPTEATPTTEDVFGDGEDGEGLFRVGVGIADMTGPCVEIAFMGYAEISQTGEGLHLRQFARSFIFQKGEERVVVVSAETQAIGIAIRREVVKNLQDLYGDIYSLNNVIIMGTHTHSAPGGYLVDFLLDISILGFSIETFNAHVDGITRSIVRAHENIVPARLYFGQTTVSDVHVNRSPYSYEYNPQAERMRYPSNVDDTLTQVKIVKTDGSLHGVMNWYAIHTTSMNMSNHLVSSDNLGYAALRMEKELNPGSLAGKPSIVTAFFTANLGDVSPNTAGARCEFSGEVCDNHIQVCDFGERCFASGPGDDMFESTRIIGTRIFEGAWEVLNSPAEELTGKLAVVHQFNEMAEQVVSRYDPITRTFDDNEQVKGCVSAMGYSFASGTIDGANTLNITQGTTDNNPLLDFITGIVMDPSQEDMDCHAPKPILLATGRGTFPLPWHPHIVSTSLIWLGDFVILGVPGEPTTMAGRRMRAVVSDVMEESGFEPRVVVSGLTNEYIHYVATYEEYQVQHYEAASTIYGPHTLDIFLNKFHEFAKIAIEGGSVPSGPEPEDNRDRTRTLILPVVFDGTPAGRSFGECVEQPPSVVRKGEVVRASFIAANPRNDLKQEGSHAVVQRLDLGEWRDVATDADWETKFIWERLNTITGTSRVTFEWTVPGDALSAQHRIVYYGAARRLVTGINNFTGYSNTFTVDGTINSYKR